MAVNMINSRKEIAPSITSKLDNDFMNKLHCQSNGTLASFSEPQITSTPLSSPRKQSIFATPPKTRLLTPKRYLLSEIATPPRSIRKEQKKLSNFYRNSGPLLASLGYNDSVRTYEETKSPGLAGRIVQYNEESEQRRHPTHHEKYASPGLFPVVHLFKKDLPRLDQKPKRVTIQIGHSDRVRRHSTEYNRKLLEGIIRPNFANYDVAHKTTNETNTTRSVLDALKEISRKRIHSNEECEVNGETGKRIRTEPYLEAVSNKRLRDESPVLDTLSSPPKPSSKRTCFYDEYSASCSSSKLPLDIKDVQATKRKTSSLGTLTENSKETKQVKLINVETQTAEEPVKTPVISSESLEPKFTNVKESPVKVFDDAPLERIRKSRLVTLMGQLVGKEAVLTCRPEPVTETSEERPLTSILSNKTSNKSVKHVNFTVSDNLPVANDASKVSITQTSTSVATPIVSAVVNRSPSLPAPPSSPVSREEPVAAPNFAFGAVSSAAPITSVVVNPPSESVVAPSAASSTTASPFVNFSSPPTSFSLSGNTDNVATTPVSSGKKMGGFKFDLKEPASEKSNSLSLSKSNDKSDATIAAFGGNNNSSPFAVKSPTTLPSQQGTDKHLVPFNFTKPAEVAPKSQSFTLMSSSNNLNPLTNSSVKSTLPAFGSVTSSTTFPTAPLSPTFSFGKSNASPVATNSFDGKIDDSKPTGFPSVPSFGSTVTAAAKSQVNAGGFNFAATTTSTTTTASSSGFGVSSKPTMAFAFGGSTTTSPFTPNRMPFGQTTAQNAPISTTSTTSTFGSTNIFGSATTTASSASSTPAVAGAGNIFGAPTTQSVVPFGNTFGNAVTSSPFGTSGTAVTTPAFGPSSSSQPVFSFGAKPTTNTGFGGSNTAATTSANSAFGTVQGFASINSVTTTTTTTSSIFGTAQTFGTASSGFGSGSSFGSRSTAGSGGFGSAPVTSFNSNQSGATLGSKPGAFSSGGNSFGSSAGGFGSGAQNPAFSFGAGTANSAFVKPQQPQSGGSSATPAFGAPTSSNNTFNAPPSQNAAFKFGSANASKPAVFAFGGASSSTTDAPKVGFNFNANSNNSPFGGGAAAPTFGSSSVPTFGAAPSAVPQFNSGANAAPQFNAGANAGPQFNAGGNAAPQFTAGANAAPQFTAGANAAPQFNAGANAAPQFNAGPAPTPGIFNIGAGSSSNRHRTQLKAKRRT